MPRSRVTARRLGRFVVGGLKALFLGLLALVLLVVICLDTPPARRLIVSQANSALSEAFQGRVTIRHIGHVGFTGIAGVDAVVDDAKGQRILDLHGLSVDLFWPGLIWDLIAGGPDLHVAIGGVRSRHIEAVLRDDGTGQPTIATAFLPKKPSPEPAKESGTTTIRIDGIELGHTWIHGGLPALPVIDAELDRLKATLAIEPSTLRFDAGIARLRGRGLPMGLDLSGKLTAKGAFPSDPKGAPRAEARWDGLVARAPSQAAVTLDGQKLDAELVAREIAPATLARLAPGVAVRDATTVEAHVEGTLPKLALRARIENSALRLDANGTAELEDPTVIQAVVKATEIDLSGLVPDAPSTRLALDAKADVRLAADGSLDAKYDVTLPSALVAGYATPGVEIDGRATRRGDGTLSARGSVDVDEPGAATHLGYDVGVSPAQGTVVEVTSNTTLAEPPRLVALAGGLKASGGVEIQARYEPEKNALDARVNARLRRVVQGANRLDSLGIAGRASGSAEAPKLSASLTAHGVLAGGRRFERVKLDVAGTSKRLAIEADLSGKNPDRIQARSVVALGPELVIEKPSVTLTDDEGRVDVSASAVRVANGAIRVDGVDVQGAGSLQASLHYTTRLEKLALESTDLDIARLLRLVGEKDTLESGVASVQARWARTATGPSGVVQARVKNLSAKDVKGGAVDVDLAFEKRKITGTLEAALGKTLRGQVMLLDVDLLEPPFTRQKLERMTGAITVKGEGDVARLALLLRESGAPIESGKGRIALDVDVRRDDLATQPVVNAKLRTYQLELLGRRDVEQPIESAAEAREAQPWHIQDIDLVVDATLDQNQRIASLLARASDRRGPLVDIDASAPLSVPLAQLPALARTLPTLPFKVSVSMPERPLQRLPKLIRPPGVRGLLAIDVRAEGTLSDPSVDAKVTLKRLRSGDRTHEIDVELAAEYEHLKGKIAIDAGTARRKLATIAAEWQGNPLDLANAEADRSPIVADVSVKLDKFPLGAIPALYDRQIRGPLSADVELRGLGKNAELKTTIQGDGIVLGRVGIQELRGLVETKNGKLAGSLRVGGNGGFLQANFATKVAWGQRIAPEIDPNPEAKLVARRFRLETIQPLVQGQISELEGRLSADVTARIDAGVPLVDGSVSLEKGVVHVPSVGQRFRDIEARVRIHEGNVQLERLVAYGLTGRVTATAGAKLAGTELRSAEAHVRIVENEKLPITMEGVALGDAWGRIDVRYRAEKARNHLLVDVPDFHMKMPADASSSLQSLDPADGIRIGARAKDRDFVTLPVQPLDPDEEEKTGPPVAATPLMVEVKLGRSVWLTRGDQVKVQLSGGIQVETGAGEPNITGRIELRGGTLDVQGKTFEIENGVVTFNGGDPSNPTITATARWDSPEGYTVYAEYSGTAQEGRLDLRSEPPLSQNEILSLVMFGTPDGSFGSGEGGSNAETAVGLAGGTAAQGLNRALSDFTSLDISARVDTSTGSSRPEIVVQLSPRLTARVTRAIGEPPPGESPDRTFLTLDLRLRRAWSLSTLLGDRGASAVDLVWRKRY